MNGFADVRQLHELDLESRHTFWLEQPIRDFAELSSANAARVSRSPTAGCFHILLVDDDDMNRDVSAALLRHAGHDVVLAENGRDAVEMASRQAFDTILMDIRMPVMDGLEATRRIRKLQVPYGATPIVALTSNCSPDQVAQCREAGMDGHVSKPANYAILMHVVSVMARFVVTGAEPWAQSTPCASDQTGYAEQDIGACANQARRSRALT